MEITFKFVMVLILLFSVLFFLSDVRKGYSYEETHDLLDQDDEDVEDARPDLRDFW